MLRRLRARRPDLHIDGELQADAALVHRVLAGCPQVRVLATSNRNLPAEVAAAAAVPPCRSRCAFLANVCVSSARPR